MFRVSFESRDFGRMTQPGLEFAVQEMRWSIEGGCDRAIIALGRDMLRAEDASRLVGMLRCGVTIRNAYGQAVWWGYLNTVEQVEGTFIVAHSLYEMANRVAVRYTTLAPFGQFGEVRQTDWADDLASQAVYGVKERIIEKSGLDDAAALQVRDVTLEEGAFPGTKLTRPVVKTGWGLRLTCLGWMHSLVWKYVQPQAGMIANTPAQHGTQYLGNTYSDLWLAQSITPTEDLLIRYIDVRLRKVGSPTDDARIQVQSDNAGVPSGTSLGQALVSPSAISAEGYPWVRFEFDPAVAVSQGTPVWLVLQRAGQPSQTDYYLAGVDESMAFEDGAFRVYNHVVTCWIARSPECDLLFRVTATQDTGEQLQAVFAAGNQFLSGMVVEGETGVESVPWLPQAETCYAQVLQLLRLGTGDQRRLLAEVSVDRRLVISVAPVAGEADWYMDEEGRYFDTQGVLAMPGCVPEGKWVRSKGGVRFVEKASLVVSHKS
jgi:hypothetical protein